MVIYRCDRCERLMNKPFWKIEIKFFFAELLENPKRKSHFDFCEDCSKGFNQFLQGVKTKEVTNDSNNN